MTWDSFFSWLERVGVRYSPGDIHYAGRGHWFPQPPDLTQNVESPLSPEPWIHVFKSAIEGNGRSTPTVDVMTSFSPAQYNIEDPKVARQAVERALMDYDMAMGAEEFHPLPIRHPEAPPPSAMTERIRIAHQRRAQEMEAGRQRAAAERAAGVALEDERREQRNLLTRGPYTLPRYVPSAEGEREAEEYHRLLKPRKHYDGITSDDSDVSDNCDMGAHERCSGCGCGCHWFRRCGCGRTFTRAQWDELPLVGTQHVEADDEGPATDLEMKDCPVCKSTLAVEV